MDPELALEIEKLYSKIAALAAGMGESESVIDDLQQSMLSLQKALNSLEGKQASKSVLTEPSMDNRLSLQADSLRFREIIDSQNDFICRYTPDGEFTFVNEAYCQNQHMAPEILLKENFIFRLPAEIQEEIHQKIKTISIDQPNFTFELSLPDSDGKESWILWINRGIFTEDGRLTEIQAIGRDITSQKLAEFTAEQHSRELQALHSATTALLTTLDLETLLSQILDAATSAITAADKGTLYLIARDTGQLELRAAIGYKDPRIKKLSISEFRGYVKKTVSEKRPLIIHDTYSELSFPPVNTIPEINSIRSAVVAPLVLKDRVLGALALESPHRLAFNEADLRLLVSFAATATNAIQNAHLHSEVQKLAVTDPLTGLYNRRGFFELGEREVARAHRYGRPLAAIMLDIDHFKNINDSYGHNAGDQVLRNVANLCINSLRKIDIVGRYGGDEFAILLPESDLNAALKVAERIRQSQENFLMPIGHHLIRASISLGIANGTRAVGNLESILKRADMAMYSAKQAGRNQVAAL